MHASSLLAIAFMLALSGGAGAFEQKVASPEFTVTVPNVPSIRLQPQAASGSNVSIAMATTVYRGMVACSHNSGQLTTATFTNVAVTGTGNQAPTVATA